MSATTETAAFKAGQAVNFTYGSRGGQKSGTGKVINPMAGKRVEIATGDGSTRLKLFPTQIRAA